MSNWEVAYYDVQPSQFNINTNMQSDGYFINILLALNIINERIATIIHIMLNSEDINAIQIKEIFEYITSLQVPNNTIEFSFHSIQLEELKHIIKHMKPNQLIFSAYTKENKTFLYMIYSDTNNKKWYIDPSEHKICDALSNPFCMYQYTKYEAKDQHILTMRIV